MANLKYDRPASGMRFRGRMVTNKVPDAMSAEEFPLLQNVRQYSNDEMRVRPGFDLLFATGSAAPITNIASYAQGQGQIRYLATSGGKVWPDTGGAYIDNSFSTSAIQSMIPYRPNASPAPWVYVGDNQSYRKFSLPSSSNVVSNWKAGIAEPQVPVDFGIEQSFFTPLATPGNQTIAYTHVNAGVITDTPKITDTVAAVFQDPALPAGTLNEYTVQTTSATNGYQTGEFLSIGTADVDCYQVKDVYPALVGTVTIAGIYYYSGTTGRCVVTPYNVGQTQNEGLSVMQQNVLSGIRRGALVTLSSETCYVLGTAIGPDGTISFEVSTTGTHAAGETLTGKPAIKVLLSSNYNGVTPAVPTVGQTISAHYASFTVASNTVGTQSSQVGITTPFSYTNYAYRPEDYIHISVMCDNLANLNECRMLLDVSPTPGAFTDYYYYAFRPSDIQAGVQNTLTQLGAAQLADQRNTIDEEAHAHGTTATSSSTLIPGSACWSDIFIPISSFQANRIGSNQNRTLLNLNYYQILVNTNSNGGVTFGFHTVDLFGGFSPDVGGSSEYRYRIRPRSRATGAIGNPSPAPRYGVSPRREAVQVVLPATYSDPQVDTWDIYRVGGTLTDYHRVGTVPIGTTAFLDNYDDIAVAAGEILEFDNLEPWPSIDIPFQATATVQGTTATVTVTSPISTYIPNYLPGNKVQIGQQVYTLWTRPTVISTNVWLFQFQENAGVMSSSAPIYIYEPAVANQQLPYLWGPTDTGGVIFGCGDTLRSGTVSYCKNFNPDSVPDNYNIELCPPSEPLLGGMVVNNQSYVFSSARYWPLRPSFTQENRWTPSQPHKKGLASPFGLASDGRHGFFISDDGIYPVENDTSITEDDLGNIFPHDGVQSTVGNYLNTFYPPDYTKANTFRLAIVAGYLYFDFTDQNGAPQTFVYDIELKSWVCDTSVVPPVVHVPVVQPPSSFSGLGPNPVRMMLGDNNGNVYQLVDGSLDITNPINFRIVTSEYLGGEERALKQWGDVYVNLLGSGTAITIQGRSGGADVAGATTTVSSTGRTTALVPMGNAELFSLGLDITGTNAATFYIWQPAYIPQPVIEQARFTDWEDGGYSGNKFWQGFILEANTNGVSKTVLVRDGDTLATHAFTPYPMNFPQQSEQAFSFSTPFIAHSVRLEPQDSVNWNQWRIKWVTVPYPEAAETWATEGMTHGLHGYQYPYQVNLAYIAAAMVTLTIVATSYDNAGNVVSQSAVVTFAATGAQLNPAKVLQKLPRIKGKVYSYTLTSTAPFYVWKEETEVWLKGWGQQIGVFNRPAPFEKFQIFGGASAQDAEV